MHEHAYAEALHMAVEQGKNPSAAVVSLHTLLKRRGRAALMPQIARAFARIAQRERARNIVTLNVVNDASRAKTEAKKILSEIGVDARDVEVHTDENLIGGWRLEGRERLYDASFKKHLLSIYNRITQ